MMFPILPTHRIVVFDGELLGERGDEYATAVVTWHDDYLPASCLAWFDAHFGGERYKEMLFQRRNRKCPIEYGLLH